MKKTIKLTGLLITISISLFGQINNLDEVKKMDLQAKAISLDSFYVCMLAGKYIKSSLGNFIKSDTIYYPNKAILRMSEAKNGYLNGNVIYYNKKGGIYLKSKWKNGEHSDTSFYYNMTDSLAMMQIYMEDGRTTIYDYYNSGELKRISKLKIVDLTPEELKKSASKSKQKAETESDQYFDKSGKEISYDEIFDILKTDYKQPSSHLPIKATNEKQPFFPGGKKAMINFLNENMVYPEYEKKKGITGTSYIGFVVEKDGSITNVQVLKGIKDGTGCDNEAVRVIKLMPNWKPAKKDGQNIKYNLMLPIKFSLN